MLAPPANFTAYLRTLLALALACCALVVAFNFAVDPLQFYRRASAYPPHYSANQRYQAPALLRTHPHDTVVLGNSHAANFEKPLVERALGGTALNLTIEGSVVTEQAAVARLALHQGQVQRILWILDFGAFALDARQAEALAASTLPRHLYRHGALAAGPYLLSLDTLVDSVRALATPPARSLDTLTSWWRDYAFGRDRVEAAWDHMRAMWTDDLRARWAPAAADREDVDALFDTYVLAQARAHPQVRFTLVFPPFSYYEYALDFLVGPERFFLRLHLKQRALDAARGLDNLQVVDFEGLPGVADEPAHYKDLGHYDLQVVERMLERIAAGGDSSVQPLTVAQGLREFLRERCGAADHARFCPPLVRCGLQRLDQWLQGGGGPERQQGRAGRDRSSRTTRSRARDRRQRARRRVGG